MCPPALLPALKFLAPMILPALVGRVLGGGDKGGPKPPDTHARGLMSKQVKQSVGGEDLNIKEDEGISEAERNANAKAALLRKRLGAKTLGSKQAPGTDVISNTLGNTNQNQGGINIGSTLSPVGG
tara:strand:+ start:1388 stop:1765 length:378 start_codon:yes stop_codon:yes gene_type:complete